MTSKWPTGWTDGDVLYSADLYDTLRNQRTFDLIPAQLTTDQGVSNIIAHSSTVWSAFQGGAYGDIYVTTDSGSTWTVKNSNLDTSAFFTLCRADTTHAVAIEYTTSGEVAFTDDSGTTWTSKTSTAFGTQIYDVSFSTAGLIVVGGNDAGGTDHIVFSTDDAANWTNATTSPSAAVYAVDMYDATTGYAIDLNGNIWKTINAAVDWTDTGHNILKSIDTRVTIYALSATVCLIYYGSNIERYDNAAGTVTFVSLSVNASSNSGFIKVGDNYYIVGGATTWHLFKSEDSGLTWKSMYIPYGCSDTNNTQKRGGITAADSNTILTTWSYGLIKIHI